MKRTVQRRTTGPRRLLVVLALAAAAALPATAQHRRLFPPDELGMLEAPDRAAWQRPEKVMDALLIAEGSSVADLGAGAGWFTIRLADRVGPNGKVYAEDAQPEMVEAIKRRVEKAALKNVLPILGTQSDPRLPAAVDAVLIVDSFHEMQEPVVLLRNVAARLKPSGRLGIVEYAKNGLGPGPPMEERVDPERVIRDAGAAGLRLISTETFLRYQFMLVFARK